MTIKELSNELGISEQALRQWCKKNNIRKESTNETKGKKASYFLDENTVEQIREYYSGKGKETKASTKGKESDPSLRFEFDILKQTIETLQQQLEVKDKQIEKMQAQISKLTDYGEKLTTALQAAQALHGMDKQQAVIETTAQADPEQTETAPAEPERKRSFFQRLFGKK